MLLKVSFDEMILCVELDVGTSFSPDFCHILTAKLIGFYLKPVLNIIHEFGM